MTTLAVSRALARRVTSGVTRRELSALVSPVDDFPGTPSTTPTPATASTASVTSLPNGLTVVSENASTTSTVTLTYPAGGSSDETVAESGAAFLNKFMSFKSGTELSAALTIRCMEDEGATPITTATRTTASVGYTAPPDKAAFLLPLLGEPVTFEKWDVADAKKMAKAEIETATSNAQVVLTENLFAAAYGAQSPMGRPFYSDDATRATAQSFRERTYGLNGAVLAATGIPDHAAFVASVVEGLGGANVGSAPAAASRAAYFGGESRVSAPIGFAHVAIGFEASGLSTPLSAVIKRCLTLMAAETAPGVSGFASALTPLVGACASVSSSDAATAADSLCTVLSTSPSADVVKRAKALAKADALFALDAGSQSLAASMTTSVLESGTFSASEIASSYDAITDSQVKQALADLKKANPSVAAVGDIAAVPYHGAIAAKLS